jgi:formylglycine-generating enzyme required for sulfatase activity
MLGNVSEWCADTYAPYPPGDAVDPRPSGDGDGVARGGGWDSGVEACNSAHRFRPWAEYRSRGTGLRLLVEAPER